MLKPGCKEPTKAPDVWSSLLRKWYNRFRPGCPTCQKSSLNSRMNLTRRENAGVFTLMGLTLRHHSNAIHELLRSQPAALSFQHITRSKTAVLDQISSPLSCFFACSHPRILQERGNISAFPQNPFRMFRICNNGRRNSL